MFSSICNRRHSLLVAVILLVVSVQAATAQTPEFAYEGFLNDGGQPANGNYDFEFRLFDAVSGGAQQGATLQRLSVAVNNGSYKVVLDFGAAVFTGENRFLEIGFRPVGGGAFTMLTPLEQITSTPYAIRSASAANADNATTATGATTAEDASQLGGVAASQYVLTSDPRLTDARNPLPGSPNYIQNTTAPQASANFNISGSGTAGGTLSANTVNATTQFNLAGNRILSNVGFANLFAGIGAGGANTTGQSNSFFGRNAGLSNTTGGTNAFFGSSSGTSNTTGNQNAFFGDYAGLSNINGSRNAFFGQRAGIANKFGNNNTLIGAGADVASTGLDYATAIGSGAVVNFSNTIVLGRSADSVRVPGNLYVGLLSGGGGLDLCRNDFYGILAYCSSSLRYKTDVKPFIGGLNLVSRLRPITFNWTSGGKPDIGFAAEEVESVEPLLVIYNAKGEIEGVKYKQISTILVNAINEQQKLIEQQQKQNQRQQLAIDGLRKLVCPQNPAAEVCREKE